MSHWDFMEKTGSDQSIISILNDRYLNFTEF